MSPVEELFDWDEANISHLARHGITPAEAERIIQTDPVILRRKFRAGEIRRNEVGSTDEGRILVICSIARGYKIRVVTGWPADKRECELWRGSQTGGTE